MMRWLIVLSLLWFRNPVFSQAGDSIRKKPASTWYLFNAGPALAIGSFAQTHGPGFGLEAGAMAWIHKKNSSAKNPVLLSWSVAADYYTGKKEATAGYAYTYPAYLLVHAFAGAAYPVKKNWLVSLTAGPGIGLYNGNAKYNTGLQATVQYAVSNRFSVSPSFKLMQEPGTRWLGALALRAQIIFKR